MPQLQAFDVCQGGACAQVDHIGLTEAEWRNVTQLFVPAPADAATERAVIALAIGVLEDMVGTKVGTTADRAGTFNNSDYLHQQDCSDEAINTTTYLRLLHSAGLLQFHAVGDLRTRHFFWNGWPHTTASLKELTSGAVYAVDSWFYDNGAPAVVMPFARWQRGDVPTDSPLQWR